MAKGLWVVLNVENVEKATEFYKALGLNARLEKMDVPGMPSAPVGTVEFADSGFTLWNKHLVPSDQPADTRAWVTGELGKGVLFTVGVPNVQKVWTNAQKLRAQIDQPLDEQPWGGHGFTFVDLDGYVISVSDKFPGASPARKAKKAVKRVAAKAKKTVRKVATKAKKGRR